MSTTWLKFGYFEKRNRYFTYWYGTTVGSRCFLRAYNNNDSKTRLLILSLFLSLSLSLSHTHAYMHKRARALPRSLSPCIYNIHAYMQIFVCLFTSTAVLSIKPCARTTRFALDGNRRFFCRHQPLGQSHRLLAKGASRRLYLAKHPSQID